MRIRAVMDLRAGEVVLARGGRRGAYRPLAESLPSARLETSDPVAVARSLRERFGLARLYLADLDALSGGAPDLRTVGRLAAAGFELLVDAGSTTARAVRALRDAGATRVVLPLEAGITPDDVERIVRDASGGHVALGLDLRDGRSLAPPESGWPGAPLALARRAVASGVGSVVVLDLGDVGEGRGSSTGDLCRAIGALADRPRIIAGGGVRGRADLARLAACGVDDALVATALHTGSLVRSDLAEHAVDA